MKERMRRVPRIEMPADFIGFEHMASYPHYDTALSRLFSIIQKKYPDLCMIDIGANIGDTIAILKLSFDCPFLAIEGDSHYFSYLKTNTQRYSNVFLENVFLGQQDETVKMTSHRKQGTAHLIESAHTQQLMALDSVLKKHPSFINTKLIKIDTDGFDNIVLKGAKNYLQKAKPIIFMEYSPDMLALQNDNGIDIFIYLASLGYDKAMMYENFGDYMFSFSLYNTPFIEEMRDYFTINTRIQYADLCLFHHDDADLFLESRASELEFFKNYKLSLST